MSVAKCVYGGPAGYRPPVLLLWHTMLSTITLIFIYVY